MTKQTIYTVGGTVQAGGGIYIKRKADDELLELCRQGEFAFILSSRQVGKSSLMVRTAQQLEKENVHSVTIDLSSIGVKVSQDEWYLGILNEISNSLNLKTDIFSWWTQYAQLGQAQRLINFFREVLLKEVKEKVVLFFDEIDSTLSIPFSDDFYIALRAAYNARSTTPDFKRLSFVLVGVAAPSDLISDNKRTPFNIGRRVEINDFTLEEALPLADGLGQQATQVLKWIFQYTSGHPYLTQRLCANLAKSKDSIDEQAVAKMVERLFTGEEGKQDNNLQFVRDMLSKRSPDVTKVLLTYKTIRAGKKVAADERSITQAHLKLSGLVRSEHGNLHVRNEIYNTVFNLRWVQENTPKNSQKIALIALGTTLGIIVLTTLAIFIHDLLVGTKVNSSIADFISTTSPTQRLSDLAQIYDQKGILSNTDSSLQAAQLFYGLSAKDQLSMFTDYGIDQNLNLQNDLVVVISHLYVTVADVDPNEDNTDLLVTMSNSLNKVTNNPDSSVLQDEIKAWLHGREQFHLENYQEALIGYSNAIGLNPMNQATFFERGKVYIALQDTSNALQDLDRAIRFAKQSAPNEIEFTPTPQASDLPGSVTPNSTQEISTKTISSTLSLEPTTLPSIVSTVTLASATTDLTVPEIATPTTTPTYIPISRYESNFTTLIDVINAVQALIETNPQLKFVIQFNQDITYTDLQAYKLVAIVTPTPLSGLGIVITETTTSSSNTEFVATKRPTSSNLGFDLTETAWETPTLSSSSVSIPSFSPEQLANLKLVPPPIDGHRPWGIDVSYWEAGIDWLRVKNTGTSFVFIKATESDIYTDLAFGDNWIGAKSVGIPRGAYHFFRANVDPAKQAEYFIQTVKAMGDNGEFPPILNLESNDGVSKEEIIPNVKIWLDLVEQGLGRKPIIYSGLSFFQTYFTESGGGPPSWAKEYTLYIASYNDQYVKDMEPPLPSGWSSWGLWQYSDRGGVDGINAAVDLNVFNGSPADLQQFLNESANQISK